ncbi:hypothetical protein [Legionella impletisoli]|uniref:Uncharacterized protein n=1 Tax=Legionella impletisoli TaxID=343510 RepID=A0A917N8T3_9GAMM|nr:hypothetical protein [Legionella impletisoli]GGI77674.1 hypothetical protein GCM10007966_02920 [Legionella impletisoli]
MNKHQKESVKQNNDSKKSIKHLNKKENKKTGRTDKEISYAPHDFDYNADHEAFRSVN